MASPDPILDSPLEDVRPVLRDRFYRRTAVDFWINAALCGLVALTGLSGWLIEEDYLIVCLIAFFALGVYQLFSSMVGGALGNTRKGSYSVFAWLYVVFLFTVFRGLFGIVTIPEWLLWTVFIAGLPSIGALYFLVLCFQAWQRSKGGER